MKSVRLLASGFRSAGNFSCAGALLPSAARAVALALAISGPELCGQADFQADANLVVLHVTVTDHQGHFQSHLPSSAFQVYEDGVRQNLTLFQHEDTPVAVGLVVDNSGSMQRKLPEVVAAAQAFAESSNPEDQMFVVHFNENVSLGLPSGEAFVAGTAKLKKAMLQVHAAGETALYDAIATGLEHIRQSPLQKKILIVVSDGGDNASKRRFPEVLAMAQHSDVIVYTVGLFDEYDFDRNPGVLRQLAKASGGEAFFPEEIPDVTNVLKAVSRDIRNQYTLGLRPNERKMGWNIPQSSCEAYGPACRSLARTDPHGLFRHRPTDKGKRRSTEMTNPRRILAWSSYPAGLSGRGRSELVRCLFGSRKALSGTERGGVESRSPI